MAREILELFLLIVQQEKRREQNGSNKYKYVENSLLFNVETLIGIVLDNTAAVYPNYVQKAKNK